MTGNNGIRLNEKEFGLARRWQLSFNEWEGGDGGSRTEGGCHDLTHSTHNSLSTFHPNDFSFLPWQHCPIYQKQRECVHECPG